MLSAQEYLIAFIVVAAVATYLTRLLPFIFLGKHGSHPLAQYLGRYLPAGIMAVLALVFFMQSATWSAPTFGLNAVIPAALVIGLHLWKRNALISMLVGTVSYMFLQQANLF